MKYLDFLLNFFTDRAVRVTSKMTVFLLVIFIGMLVDDTFGFTYYYNNAKKIEQLNSLQLLIRDTSSDDITKLYATSMRNRIILRKSLIDQFSSFLRSNFTSSNKTKTISPADKPTASESPNRNNFLFLVTSGGLYILVGLAFVPLFLVIDKKQNLFNRTLLSIAMFLSISILGLFFYWLFGYIPKISKSTWAYNYILNSVLQMSIIAISARMQWRKIQNTKT